MRIRLQGSVLSRCCQEPCPWMCFFPGGNFPRKESSNFIEEEEEMALSENFGHSARSISFLRLLEN